MINFSKLQGAGNDFIIINSLDRDIENLPGLAKKMCDRHFGVGADGLMVVKESDKAHIQMLYYNSDGSQGEMCGNGIRCFAKYVFDKGIIPFHFFTIETLAGIKEVELHIESENVVSVCVDMGKWSFDPFLIPVTTDKNEFLLEKIEIGQRNIEISCVLMGVPHAVIFVDNIDASQTVELGSKIENMKIFPRKINVNFVKILDKSNILVDTWERGAGKTLACGTGICASVIIANKLGFVDNSVNAKTQGGNLDIYISEDKHVFMKGKAELICSGEFYLD